MTVTMGSTDDRMLRGADAIPMPARGEPPLVTRFAPSPSGYLHIGHAYSALFGYEAARLSGGRFLLRIEDIDTQRCRPEFERAIFEDLTWLGLRWHGEPLRQSARMQVYADALVRLQALGVLYPCFCTRKQIRAEIEHSGRAPHGPNAELVYPGICRDIAAAESCRRMDQGEPFAWRLDLDKSLALTGPLAWYDCRAGWVEAKPQQLGDPILARKDTPTSYHLACTHDDAAQSVTHVIRGVDLQDSTHVHVLLQALMGWPTPVYHHHPLKSGPDGRRFAKRDKSQTLRALREGGMSAAEVRRLAAF